MKLKQILSIPNVLSFIRIALIPFILWAFFIGEMYLSAGLIILSGLTDIVDGYIARTYNMITPLGKALDPIADKLTLFSLLIALSIYSRVIFIVLFLFAVKEVILGIEGIIIIKKTGTTYSSKWHGKLTTLFLYLTMLAHIIFANIPAILSIILLVICDILMALTLTFYTVQNIKVLKDIHQKNI